MKIKSYYVTVTKDNMYGGSGMNRKHIIKTKEELDTLLDSLLVELEDRDVEVTVTSFDEDGATIDKVVQ